MKRKTTNKKPTRKAKDLPNFHTRNNLQRDLNNIEIYGLVAMFNEFFSDYENLKKINPTEFEARRRSSWREFFYCDHRLQSSDAANGTPIYFEGYRVGSLAKRAPTQYSSGDLSYIILEDKNGEDKTICEFNPANGQWYIMKLEGGGVIKEGKTFSFTQP